MPHYIRSNSLCNCYALQMIKIHEEKKIYKIKTVQYHTNVAIIPLTRLPGTHMTVKNEMFRSQMPR